ncbi:cytochrome P450 CYP94D108-like [Aristolochia californica]|uniref:cytochrome P450 CYP94D108-like n=1 Tax=Aristolochia californica TaxID=171875 RepID=UPI0035D74A24
MTEILILQPTNSLMLQRAGDSDGIIPANTMNIEHMLKTNFENYPKGNGFASMLQNFLGQGIFISDGEQWKAQRKTASFEFNTKSLRNFVMDAVLFEVAERLVPLLERAAGNQKILDLQDILERFAFDNVCKLAFNEDPGCLAGDGASRSGFVHAFDDAANISAARFMYTFPILWKIKKFLNVGSERRLREPSTRAQQDDGEL